MFLLSKKVAMLIKLVKSQTGVIQQDMQPPLFCNLLNFPLSIKEMDSSRERSSFS